MDKLLKTYPIVNGDKVKEANLKFLRGEISSTESKFYPTIEVNVYEDYSSRYPEEYTVYSMQILNREIKFNQHVFARNVENSLIFNDLNDLIWLLNQEQVELSHLYKYFSEDTKSIIYLIEEAKKFNLEVSKICGN